MKNSVLNQIHVGDCIEMMKGWPDKFVDLVVTDPPYGMRYHSNYYKGMNPFDPIEGDDRFPIEALSECLRLARCAVLVFCRWENIPQLPKPKSFIVWAKNNWTAGDLEHEYGRSWEGIAFYPLAAHRFSNKRPPDVYDFRRVPATELNHPTEKPLALMERLIDCNAGNIVLDPFCGSGTTLLAAERLGRKWIGIEMNPEYVAIANARIARERAQIKMAI